MSVDEFYHEFMHLPYSRLDIVNPFQDVIYFLDAHFKSCRYFNGFSIAKRPSRDRDAYGNITVRCSCGETISINRDMWRIRVKNIDLEDVIEDLNFQAQGRQTFNVKQHLNQYVESEIKRRILKAELEAQWLCKEVQSKGRNPIFDLEV